MNDESKQRTGRASRARSSRPSARALVVARRQSDQARSPAVEDEPLSLREARVSVSDPLAATDLDPRSPRGARLRRSDAALRASWDTAPEEEAAADPLIGLVLAERYRILDLLGRGGMGIVYAVEHTRIGKLMAMKLLAGELSANKEVVRRFKREALTASKLSNPHTVQVFDYGSWQHLTYLVMELVEGQDLSRVLRQHGPLPFSRLGKLLVQVCGSLAEAHAKGIVHRDIKPENVMIVPADHGHEIAKVLDFGLAKLRETSELNEQTLAGAVVGTPYFMSPEQVLGEEVDGRADIYSLGAVMFRALTGTYPFNAGTPMGMFTKHLTATPPSASARAPRLGIPESVSELVCWCLQKRPEDRPQKVEELRDALLAELNACGMSGAEKLYLTGKLPSVPPMASDDDGLSASRRDKLAHSQLATRDEVLAYERKLRRQRYSAVAALTLVTAGAVSGAGWYAFHLQRQGEGFHGEEIEPNDTAAQATPLPLGRAVTAYLGKRLEPGVGDRDFFRFVLGASGPGLDAHVTLSVTALPNFPTCTMLYQVGFPQPLARYCTGRPGQSLEVPALRLRPAEYLLAVTQDPDPRGLGEPTYVHENVSDPYQVTVGAPERLGPEAEVEPNDDPSSAMVLGAGARVTGTLAWLGDIDVICADPSLADAPVAWRIEDGKRPAGTVLEVTPRVGDRSAPLVRVHAEGAQPFGHRRLEADVNSPWQNETLEPASERRCVGLRLALDPWVEGRAGRVVEPDTTTYRVQLLRSP